MVPVAMKNFTCDEEMLSLENDLKWLMFIKEDNSEEVERKLESCDPTEKQRLVNGRFIMASEEIDEFECDADDYDDPSQMLAQHPWSIAAVHGANKVLAVLQR